MKKFIYRLCIKNDYCYDIHANNLKEALSIYGTNKSSLECYYKFINNK